MSAEEHLHPDQFFHGTRHVLKPGQVLEGGKMAANQGYGDPHPYTHLTGNPHVAAHFAEAGNGPDKAPNAKPRVYHVEPVDPVEPDPDEPHPDSMSYRTKKMRVVRQLRAGEVDRAHPRFKRPEDIA